MPAKRLPFDESHCCGISVSARNIKMLRPALEALGFVEQWNDSMWFDVRSPSGIEFRVGAKRPSSTTNLFAFPPNTDYRMAVYHKARKAKDGTTARSPHRTLGHILEGMTHVAELQSRGKLGPP